MLTDNGRQYTSWRGKVQFEKEIGPDANPAYPLTAAPSADHRGKIRTVLETIKEEVFLPYVV